MTSVSIHRIKKINIDQPIYFETTGSYVLNIHIHTENDIITLSLFSDNRDNLKINK